MLSYLLEDFYPQSGGIFAAFHPSFIVEHALSACRYLGIEPQLNEELVKDALENLFLAESPEPTAVALPRLLAQEFQCAQDASLRVENLFD